MDGGAGANGTFVRLTFANIVAPAASAISLTVADHDRN
jgi:hypothetical protein